MFLKPAPINVQTLKMSTGYPGKVIDTDPDHLLAFWRLNEIAGSVATDSSGNGRDGTYVDCQLAGDTFLDGSAAASFDGSASFVKTWSASLAAAFSSNTGSLIAWSKAPIGYDFTAIVVRFASGAASSGSVLLANNRAMWSAPTSENISYSRSTAVWQFAAITWASTMKLYVDGLLAGESPALATWTNPTIIDAYTLIGAANFATLPPAAPFAGSIANVAVWDVVLTPAQIANLASV